MNIKMKMLASLKVWIVIYPSITLFLYVFGESLNSLPLYLRTLLISIVLVPWMVFIGIPLLELTVRTYLMKRKNSRITFDKPF